MCAIEAPTMTCAAALKGITTRRKCDTALQHGKSLGWNVLLWDILGMLLEHWLFWNVETKKRTVCMRFVSTEQSKFGVHKAESETEIIRDNQRYGGKIVVS